MNKRKLLYRLFSILFGLVILYSFGFGAAAQDDPPAEDAAAEEMMITAADAMAAAETVQTNLDMVWILWPVSWCSSCRPGSPCLKAA